MYTCCYPVSCEFWKCVSPGAQLILTAPDKVSKLLIVGVVVMLNSVEQRRSDLHQSVVGHLLLFATGVAIVQVVNLVCNLCKDRERRKSEKKEEKVVQRNGDDICWSWRKIWWGYLQLGYHPPSGRTSSLRQSSTLSDSLGCPLHGE